MNYYIITGTSRGLGEAIALNLLKPNNHLFCISRRNNQILINKAAQKNVQLQYYTQDLNQLEKLDDLFDRIFNSIDLSTASKICLINNAGTLSPITSSGKYKTIDVIRNINVNLTAPIILSGLFVKHTANSRCDKRIINISSGAAEKAYFGWGNYCAAKAGLNHFTRAFIKEQAEAVNPVKAICVAPGVVDTEMQEQIRNASKEDFIDLDRFRALKTDGVLLTPDTAAKKIITLLECDDFPDTDFIRIENI